MCGRFSTRDAVEVVDPVRELGRLAHTAVAAGRARCEADEPEAADETGGISSCEFGFPVPNKLSADWVKQLHFAFEALVGVRARATDFDLVEAGHVPIESLMLLEAGPIAAGSRDKRGSRLAAERQ